MTTKKDYLSDIEHTYRQIESSKERNIWDIKHNHNVYLLKSYISSYIEQLLWGTPDSLFSPQEIDTLKGYKESNSTKKAEQLVTRKILWEEIDVDGLLIKSDEIDEDLRDESENNIDAAINCFKDRNYVMKIFNCNSQDKQGIIKEIRHKIYRKSSISTRGITKDQLISDPNLIAIDEDNIPNWLNPWDTFCIYCSWPKESGYITVKIWDTTTRKNRNNCINDEEVIVEKEILIRIAELREDLLKELWTNKAIFLELYYKIRDHWHGVAFMGQDDLDKCTNDMKSLYNFDNNKLTSMTQRLWDRFNKLPIDKVMYVRRLLS